MKTPISFYGGKQKLCSLILDLIPKHILYCEPFVGGGAVFFSKEPSEAEVLNDTNSELINFYKVAQSKYFRPGEDNHLHTSQPKASQRCKHYLQQSSSFR